MLSANAIGKILRILQTDASSNQIAFGAVLGVFFGLVPGIFFKCLFFVLIMLLRVNMATAVVSTLIFAVAGLFTDPLTDKLGYAVLTADFLFPLWTSLYNTPAIPLTNFNNTIVMGSITLSFIFSLPAFFIAKAFVFYYRVRWHDKVAKWKVIKLLTAGSISHNIFK